MSLINPLHARSFLEQYKRLLSEIAGRQLDGTDEYAEAREALYGDGLNKTHFMDSDYDTAFVAAVRNADYGLFVYAKKYRQGYALKSGNGIWYCVQALTTPLDEMLPDWILVETAILPYHNLHVCDGLLVNKNVLIGKNMINDMIQELKIERPRWSSNQRMQ